MTTRTRDRLLSALISVLAITAGMALFSGVVAIGSPPDHGVAPGDPSAVEHAAGASWWALRKGIVGIALLFALHFGGAYLYRRRGYIVLRWPRLDVGQAWAVLAAVVSTTATLVPLAFTGDLAMPVVLAQIGAAAGLLTHSTLQPGPVGATPPVSPGNIGGVYVAADVPT